MNKKKQQIRNSKGITLIALVLTIIVLVILAGVSINLVMDENGLINRAKEQKIVQAKAEILQELELAKGVVAIDGEGYTSLQKYLTYINEKGLSSHNVTSVSEIDDKNAEIVVDDKFVYTAEQIGNNVIITEVGTAEDLYPEISSYRVKEKSSNSITIEVTGRRAEEYEFYIKAPNGEYKKDGEEKIDASQVNSWNTITYTYEGLKSIAEDESYEIRVLAKRGSRQTQKEFDSVIENIVPAEGNVKMQISTTEWTNDKIITTVTTELSKYYIQYQINATSETLLDNSKWTTYAEPIVSEKNEVIYIRLFDGVNAGQITTQEITKIDKEAPTGNVEITSVTENTISVKVTASDKQASTTNGMSGIKAYGYSKDNGNTYADTTSDTYTFTNLNPGTSYKMKVRIYDNAGNTTDITTDSTSTVKLPEAYNNPYIPDGFTHTQGTWNSGYVIRDGKGNEFVWVPCVLDQEKVKEGDKVETFKKTLPSTNSSSDPYYMYKVSSITVTGDEGTSASEIETSVGKYGGFYIARYEAGIEGATENYALTTKTAVDGSVKPLSKSGKGLWNAITRTDAITVAESMVNTEDGVKSALISGACWDTTLQWIVNSSDNSKNEPNLGYDIDSTKNGWYSDVANSSRRRTGYYSVNNIYDMAGNVWEWTTENCTYYGSNQLVNRGGSYISTGSGFPAARRNGGKDAAANGAGFRVVLYK